MNSTANLELEQPSAQQPVKKKRVFGLTLIIPLLVLSLVAAVFGLTLMRRAQGQPVEGPAPTFTLTTLQGPVYKLSDLRGKVVVLNFWASWCAPCRSEAPELEAAWQQYKNQDVLFLGVAYTDTERGARAFIEQFKQTYPNGLDLGTRISALYGITGVPETFIIDRQGKVAAFRPLPLDRATLGSLIDSALANK